MQQPALNPKLRSCLQGNLRSTDAGGPYNLSLVPTQVLMPSCFESLLRNSSL